MLHQIDGNLLAELFCKFHLISVVEPLEKALTNIHIRLAIPSQLPCKTYFQLLFVFFTLFSSYLFSFPK